MGSSGNREGFRGETPMDMLDPPLVLVQNENHEAAGPEHETQTQNMRK